MSKALKGIKSGARRALKLVGYTVHKLPDTPRKSSDVIETVVAGRTLKIHGGNPLRGVYEQNPTLNFHLAFAALLVKEKYPEARAIDVGANIGDTLAIIRSRANLPVICIEGDPHCFRLLEENSRQFDNVLVYNMFLSSEPGSAFVETQKEGWNTTLSTVPPKKEGRMVKFETLDTLTGGLKCQNQIKLIKVDTEGFDMRILRGGADILADSRPVITFELNKDNIEPLGDSFPGFLQYLAGLGYERFFLTNPDGKPICILESGDKKLFHSLYDYSGYGHAIHYIDVWAFHRNDRPLFDKFVSGENDFLSSIKKG